MNSVFHRILLASANSRWGWFPWNALRPSPRQTMGVLIPFLHGLVGFAVGGVLAAGIVLITIGFRDNLALGVGGAWGFLSLGLWWLMIRSAWNRRAAELNRQSEAPEVAPREPALGLVDRWILRPLLRALVVCAALGLVYSFENFRGLRALRNAEAELKARHAPIAIQDVIPPPVPDERNLAMCRLFKPVLDYGRPDPTVRRTNSANGYIPSIEWRDPEGWAAAQRRFPFETNRPSMFTFASSTNSPGYAERKANKMTSDDHLWGRWTEGHRMPLPLWQAYYRSLPGWPKSDAPQSPGKDVLLALSGSDADLAELHASAAERPEGRFPIRYEDGPGALLPHLSALKRAATHLNLRTIAHLAENQPDKAHADLALAYRLGDLMADEPFLISLLVRIAMDQILVQSVWEGTLDQRWTEPQLAHLQQILESRDYLTDLRKVLEGERACLSLTYNMALESPRAVEGLGPDHPDSVPSLVVFLELMPRGWIRQNQVSHYHYLQHVLDRLAAARSAQDVANIGNTLPEFFRDRSLLNTLSVRWGPAYEFRRIYDAETSRRLALTGLALERFRLAEGTYPDTLEKLSPRFLKAILPDPMDGRSLRYVSDGKRGYQLYSVGTDGKDDGGARAKRSSGRNANPDQPGDLVWR